MQLHPECTMLEDACVFLLTLEELQEKGWGAHLGVGLSLEI